MARKLWRVGLWLMGAWAVFCVALGIGVHLHGRGDEARPADVIIVLGAGVDRSGRAGFALSRRATHAITLYQQGLAKAILCSGGVPPNRPNSEAYACQQFLLARGIPQEAIFLEERSRSTEENAFYSADVLRANGWEQALVVTDAFHILRARWIFAQAGVHAGFSPVPAERVNGWNVYLASLTREVAALHWQAFKTLLGLPITYVPWI
jgi:uncharacterized SAM-binding protein YcdF (DUF218 family)